MPTATADGITVINLGRRSHNMANAMNLLSAVESEAMLPPGQMRRRHEKPRGRPGVADRGDLWRGDRQRLPVRSCPRFPHFR